MYTKHDGPATITSLPDGGYDVRHPMLEETGEVTTFLAFLRFCSNHQISQIVLKDGDVTWLMDLVPFATN